VSFTVQTASNVVSLVQHTGKDAGTATSSSLAFNANNSAGSAESNRQSDKLLQVRPEPCKCRSGCSASRCRGTQHGGDITRTLPLQLTFLGSRNFGQGNIHKVITIDTPHLGSPLATNLLMSQNNCVRNLLAFGGMPSFQSVQVVTSMGPGALTLPAAVGDLVDSPTSQALLNINTAGQGSHPLPTALIAGIVNSTNLAGLANTNTLGFAIHSYCGTILSNPLAVNLTPTGWPTVFGEENDAIVGQTSQLANLNADPGQLFSNDGSGRGFLHTPGVEPLGFLGPTVLDPGLVPSQVITLLNTPVSSQVFHLLNP